MDIDETKRKRLLYLNLIYERVGDNELASENAKELAVQLGLAQDESDRIREYLYKERLISYPSYGHIGITHQGIKEMERVRLHPEQPTSFFPPINVIQMGDVQGSPVIQQGTVTSTQSVNYSQPSADDLKRIIESIRKALPELALPEESKTELASETNLLETYSASSNLKHDRIQQILKSIRSILEGTAGSLVASGIIDFITRYLH